MNKSIREMCSLSGKVRVDKKRILLITMASVLYLTLSEYSWSTGIINAPLPVKPCPSGSENMNDNQIEVCTTSTYADSSGLIMVGAGADYKVGLKGSYVGRFDGAYPPFSGNYTDKIYICATTEASKCTIKQASDYITGLSTFYLNSKITISTQNPDAGGPSISKTIPYAYSFCQVIVDTKGNEWASEDATSCSDAHHLPTTPADCYINYGEDLNVDMGDIERSKIPTIANVGEKGNLKKDLNVLCTRDSAITVKTKFQFSPVTINGQEVIPTGMPGVGIALFYRGKRVSPSDFLEESYTVGYSDFDLEFAPVRDETVAVKDIPTGRFNASVVMIMTEQ